MPVSNSPRAYGRVRNPLLKKENKNYKNLQKENSQKQKQKKLLPQSQCPVKTPRPQERNISYQDMMLPKLKKVMVQCFVTEEDRRFDS